MNTVKNLLILKKRSFYTRKNINYPRQIMMHVSQSIVSPNLSAPFSSKTFFTFTDDGDYIIKGSERLMWFGSSIFSLFNFYLWFFSDKLQTEMKTLKKINYNSIQFWKMMKNMKLPVHVHWKLHLLYKFFVLYVLKQNSFWSWLFNTFNSKVVEAKCLIIRHARKFLWECCWMVWIFFNEKSILFNFWTEKSIAGALRCWNLQTLVKFLDIQFYWLW